MRSDKTVFVRKHYLLRKIATCASALVMCIASGQAAADDTEVFFGDSASTNVLFILDVSGSMGTVDNDDGFTRLDKLKAALKALLKANDRFNAGLISYSSNAIELHQEIAPVAENKSELIEAIEILEKGGNTPTQRALYEGLRYYSGGSSLFGTPAQTYTSPISSQCQSNHIVLLSDGFPSEDDSGHTTISDNIGKTCVTVDVGNRTSNGTCGVELAEYLGDTDHSSLINGLNNITTHTVGLNFDEKWLADIAKAGDGGSYNANTASELLEAFADIVEVAQSEGNSFVSPSVTVDQFSRLSHREDTYLALFQPGNKTQWTGNLKRYSFSGNPVVLRDKNGNAAFDGANGTFYDNAHSYWSDSADGPVVANGGAAHKLDPATRNVYTHTGNANLNHQLNKVHEDNIEKLRPFFYDTAELEKLLPWARGIDVTDEDEDGLVDDYRNHIGDPLHSIPTVLNYGGTSANPDSVVFVGTNEGYLHAINSNDGTELYSFIPSELLANLEEYFHNPISSTRNYGLDGDITLWIDDKNNDGTLDPASEHAYEKDNPKFMWSIKGGAGGSADFAELGQSWSKPTLSKVKMNGEIKDVLIFGGGYDPMQDLSSIKSADTIGRSLFIVDASDGSLLWTPAMDTVSDYTAMEYSMPSDPTILDVNDDGLADQIYIGDMGGQLWRFDLKNDASAAASAVSGGLIATLSGNGIANNRRFFYPPDVAITAQNDVQYLSLSIGSGNRAHPLDESVHNRFYMIRQEAVAGAPEGYGMVDKAATAATPATYRAVTEADLYDATANDVDSSDTQVSLDAHQALNSKQGWLLQLQQPGEKVLSSSLTIENSVLFATYIPGQTDPNDPCAPSIGGGRAYVVSLFDASPVNGESVADRHQNLEQPGIAGGPTAVIMENGDIEPLVGFESVDMPEISLTKRVYWSEQTQY